MARSDRLATLESVALTRGAMKNHLVKDRTLIRRVILGSGENGKDTALDHHGLVRQGAARDGSDNPGAVISTLQELVDGTSRESQGDVHGRARGTSLVISCLKILGQN